MRTFLSLASALVLSAVGSAQITVTSAAPNQFTSTINTPSLGSFGAVNLSSTGTGNFNPGTSLNPTTDGLVQHMFFVRATGDTAEAPFGWVWTAATAGTNARTITYRRGVAGGGSSTALELAVTYTMFGVNTVTGTNAAQMSGSQGYMKIDYSLKNFGTTARNVELFPYFHMSPRDSFGSDQSATITKTGDEFKWSSPTGLNSFYLTTVNPGYRYQSGLYFSGTGTGLREVLGNSSATTLGDTIGPAATNSAVALQYSFANVPANGASAVTGTLYLGYNMNPVPEPASMAALGLGVFGLVAKRRKK